MKTIHKLVTYAMCLGLLLLPACEGMGLTSPQRDAARQSLLNELNVGRITQAQYDAAVESLNRPTITADDWANWLIAGGSVVASILTGVPIAVGFAARKVEKERGAPRTAEQTAELQKLVEKV
jgi:hypothetical protein